MHIPTETLKEIVVSPGHISSTDFESAVKRSAQESVPTTEILVRLGLITDENIGKAIANYFDFHFESLDGVVFDNVLLSYFPEIVARSQQSIVFAADEHAIKLATTDPYNYEFISHLKKKTGKEVEVFYTTERKLEEALRHYKGDLGEQLSALLNPEGGVYGERAVIEIVDLFLTFAHDSRASDIHIEPLDDEILVRFRIDGILHEVTRYPKELHEKVAFRIKIMSHMQTDEHAAAQDGRFDYEHDGDSFDVRVSIIPITDGENIVMRLLASRMHQYTLETLGLRDEEYEKVIRAMQKPHGMILAVGPTGSGKTTVLYTILRKLNRPEVNIMTVEDPVEYGVEGVQQTQVNERKKLTFSTGLRSIVRQDPDIIMVGEIRDEATASIAVNAAMTGHLLLSTLHTNDAATTFPRLTEMKVEPFLMASSVSLVVAVRLVRLICSHCKESYMPSARESKLAQLYPELMRCLKELTGKDDMRDVRLYRGKGCKSCGETGYSGRTGIYEILEVNEPIRMLLMERSSASVINKAAKEYGMTPLIYDGITKMLSGTTTLEEILRAANA